jgi:hypothetical protein
MAGFAPGIHAVPRDVAVKISRRRRGQRHPAHGRVKPPGHQDNGVVENFILRSGFRSVMPGSSPGMTDHNDCHE